MRLVTAAAPSPAPTGKPVVPGWIARLTPRAGVRVQLVSAAVVWLVGAGIMLVRGALFLHDRWVPLIVAAAILIGLTKERYVLNRYARKAVARIHARGRACWFGFFSVKAWFFIAVMMGGGIALRRSVFADTGDVIPWGRDLLALIYVAVGTALAHADRVYWQAACAKSPEELDAVEHREDRP
jgi:hypothetical protein